MLPVRLQGYKKKTGGEVEALLIRKFSNHQWQVLLKPGKRIHCGSEIIFSSQLEGKVINKNEKDGSFLIKMQVEGNINEILHKIGKMPTPPYIKKELNHTSAYQTVYASQDGSIAAPTAGFHFTHKLLEDIKKKGIKIIFLTLHIGRGTFEKMKVNQVENHKMQAELYTMSAENAKIVNQALQDNARIIGVGTSEIGRAHV